ncbi:MAG TPA: hypothetical protein VFH51_11980 [Myxococcota bacterium]|nr:hypothetical protein [Myxococcota bacterium]
MSPDARIWYQDQEHAVATCGPLVLQLWRGKHTYRNWRAESTPVFRQVNAQASAGYCVLIMAEESASAPDAEARREIDELARERASKVLGSAVVAYGSPVRIAAVRATVMAVNVFSQNKMRVFNEAPPALTSLAQVVKQHALQIDVPRATALVNEMRQVKRP